MHFFLQHKKLPDIYLAIFKVYSVCQEGETTTSAHHFTNLAQGLNFANADTQADMGEHSAICSYVRPKRVPQSGLKAFVCNIAHKFTDSL